MALSDYGAMLFKNGKLIDFTKTSYESLEDQYVLELSKVDYETLNPNPIVIKIYKYNLIIEFLGKKEASLNPYLRTRSFAENANEKQVISKRFNIQIDFHCKYITENVGRLKFNIEGDYYTLFWGYGLPDSFSNWKFFRKRLDRVEVKEIEKIINNYFVYRLQNETWKINTRNLS